MSNIEIEVPTGGSVKLSDLNLPQANSTWAAETLKLAGKATTETKKKSEAKEELEAPSAEELAAGKAAQKALIDINKTGKAQAKRSWDDWMLVGAGVAACMEYAKRCGDGHTTNPKYKAAKAAFEQQFNLVSLHKSTASRLRKCYENRKAVEAWREEQEKVGNYQNLNHPVAVWSAYHSGKKSSEVRDAKWV